MRYADYLKSDHWRALKAEKASKRPKRCALCRSATRVDCHHVLYRRWFDVQTSDVRWLCRECHGLVHAVLDAGEVRPSKKNRANAQAIWILVEHAIARRQRRSQARTKDNGDK